MMNALVVRDKWLKGIDELKVSSFELPSPCDPDEVIVAIKAVGANFFDILLVMGKYQVRPPFPFVPGSEVKLIH